MSSGTTQPPTGTASLVIAIITAALQLAPLALSTIAGIKELLSRDPSVPEQLKTILADTEADNAATLAAVQAWLAAHPT